MKLEVNLFKSEEGFAVCVPSLPGCWSQGATKNEALVNIAEAVREYLDADSGPTNGAPGVSGSPPLDPDLIAEAEVREVEIAD